MQSFPSLPAVLVWSCITSVIALLDFFFFFVNALFIAALHVNLFFFCISCFKFSEIFKSKKAVQRFLPAFPLCGFAPSVCWKLVTCLFLLLLLFSSFFFHRSSAFGESELCLCCLVYANEMFSGTFFHFPLMCHDSANCYAITCIARSLYWLGSAIALPECDRLWPAASWLRQVLQWFSRRQSAAAGTCHKHRFWALFGRAFTLGSNMDMFQQR